MTRTNNKITRQAVVMGAALALGLVTLGAQAQEGETPTEEITLPTVTVETDLAEPEPEGEAAQPTVAAVAATPDPAPKKKPKRRKPAAAPRLPQPVQMSAPEEEPEPFEPAAPVLGGAGAQISGATVGGQSLASSDVSTLLQALPGASVWGAGGVSGLPAINGMGADRVQVALGGMMTGPACPNQMNPTLSYAAPAMLGALTAHSASAPVSAGGDFSGGRIDVEPPAPVFAEDNATQKSGSISAFYRSNAMASGIDATASLSTANSELTYRGSFVSAGNYHTGDGTEMLSTEFESQNHTLEFTRKGDDGTLRLSFGGQYMPGQGFPTQPMDMTVNRSLHLKASFEAETAWGSLEASAYAQRVRHGMNLMADKLAWPSFDGSQAIMPMDTRGRDIGGALKATLPLTTETTLRLGLEAHSQHLDDWWDPLADDPSMMMSPEAFITLNGATRDRIGAFAELQRDWGGGLASTFGLRLDHVHMNTGEVHGYGAIDPSGDPQYGGDALVFNAANRARNDLSLDASAALTWEPDAGQSHAISFARRTRVPNLYERYAWSTNIMAMQMTGWSGDGNGHVGNLDLQPEVNHALDLNLRWRDAAQGAWEVAVNPTYAYVRDFIDADRCTATAISAVYTRCGGADNAMTGDDFVFLRFANHDAHLLGLNVSGKARLADSAALGRFDLGLRASALRGWRADGGNLYNIMPPNATLSLEHRKGGWSGAVDLQMVGAKHLTSGVRNEVKTPGYGLVNLRGSYSRDALRVDLGIENLFDRTYALPLGGANLTNGAVVVGQMVSPVWGNAMQGAGRSLNLRVTWEF